MAAVKDQSARYERLQKNFAKHLSRQLNNLFIHQVKFYKNQYILSLDECLSNDFNDCS